MTIPLPPTHAEVEADRQARALDDTRTVRRVVQLADALATLKDAGYRSLEMAVVLDGRRQWRTVWIAPEGK